MGAVDEFDFSNRVGNEMFELLRRRSLEQLRDESDVFSAMMGAALIAMAEVLRRRIEDAPDRALAREKVVEFSAKWLHQLLEPVVAGQI